MLPFCGDVVMTRLHPGLLPGVSTLLLFLRTILLQLVLCGCKATLSNNSSLSQMANKVRYDSCAHFACQAEHHMRMDYVRELGTTTDIQTCLLR